MLMAAAFGKDAAELTAMKHLCQLSIHLRGAGLTVDSSATAAALLLKQSSMVSPAMSTTPPADMAHPMITCEVAWMLVV
jgi:hypothetical protein